MSCSSALHTVNNTETSLSAGSNVPFGATIRRFGRYISHGPDGIALTDRGYYYITVTITAELHDDGTAEACLCLDGEPIAGGCVKQSARSGECVTLPLTTLVRVCEKELKRTVTVKLICGGTVTNMSTVVMKV